MADWKWFYSALLGCHVLVGLVRYARAGHAAFKHQRVRYAALISVIGIGLFVVNAAVPSEAVAAIHIAGLFLALADAGYLFLLSTFLVEKS